MSLGTNSHIVDWQTMYVAYKTEAKYRTNAPAYINPKIPNNYVPWINATMINNSEVIKRLENLNW